MSKPRKRFENAILLLQTYPSDDRSKSHGHVCREAFASLAKIIEEEQSFRLNHPARTGPFKNNTIESMSGFVLSAHKGWANRIVDTADGAWLSDDGLLDTNSNAYGIFCNAKAQLLNTHHQFSAAKHSRIARAFHSLRVTLAKLWGARPRFPKKLKEVEKSDFDMFRGLKDEGMAFPSPPAGWDAMEMPTPYTAQLVKPEEAGHHGVEIKARDRKCSNLICFDGMVYGERFGSEDYPCRVCNLDAYKEWQLKNHPSDKQGAMDPQALEALYTQLPPEELKDHYLAAKVVFDASSLPEKRA